VILRGWRFSGLVLRVETRRGHSPLAIPQFRDPRWPGTPRPGFRWTPLGLLLRGVVAPDEITDFLPGVGLDPDTVSPDEVWTE